MPKTNGLKLYASLSRLITDSTQKKEDGQEQKPKKTPQRLADLFASPISYKRNIEHVAKIYR